MVDLFRTLFVTDSSTNLLLLAAIALIISIYCFSSRSNSVYLIDFSCYLPPDHLRVPPANFIEHTEISGNLEREAIDFQVKLGKSLFCPTPSITATLINKFGFRSNVKSISLSGMGCSAGLLSISLAKDLLKVHKNSIALVLSMEAVTPNGYEGKSKSMLLANALFRMGGAAVLLSNKKQDKHKAKYKLQHLVRTHLGSNDQSYQSVFQEPDEDGFVGVSLSRALLHVAGNALRINMSNLGPLVLPYSEQLQYACAAWKCISTLDPNERNAWSDRIHLYPVEIPDVFDH
ncbi:3-ketoacyl-CoA synthase 7 [Actinidia rufa]|uniref:3-ketoacyl-CoA synthase 7 n=1 Tax=Actinidia rufa TaxID=165716 RepID=A0A7J0ET04_9ERIC|nr:3-ketoacyl-CoA synthase 7 [Actinidia rufa]